MHTHLNSKTIHRRPVTTKGGYSNVTVSDHEFFSTSVLISTVFNPAKYWSLFDCLCLWSVMPDCSWKRHQIWTYLVSELPTETAFVVHILPQNVSIVC